MGQLRLIVFGTDPATVIARSCGMFKSQGLDVDITVTPNSTDQMRGLSMGTWDIASTAFDNVLAWSGREGAEIVAVAQTADRVMLPVLVRPEIQDWHDLAGRRLGCGCHGYGICFGASARPFGSRPGPGKGRL